MRNSKSPQAITRRTFLKIGGMGAALMMAGEPLARFAARADTGPLRRLVVLEMNGGNDGLNTVIPYSDANYYHVRNVLAIPASRVLAIDNDWGLHYSLKNLKSHYDQGQVAIIRGVGHTDPDLSHFRMMDIWRAGDPSGANAEGSTGWVGRMLEHLSLSSAPLAALSIDSTLGPMLDSRIGKVASAQTASGGALSFPGYNDVFHTAIESMALSTGQPSPEMQAARQGLSDTVALTDFLANLTPPSAAYPDTNTGRALAFAARVLAANDWVRIVHVPLPLDHDTHINQLTRQEASLAELDGAVDAFITELKSIGLFDQTLTMTVSEFGRRVDINGSGGTDHGTASSHFLIGASISGGLHGDPPSLTRLDPNGNLVTTSSFLDLEATACAWMGADPKAVLPGGTPYTGILTT